MTIVMFWRICSVLWLFRTDQLHVHGMDETFCRALMASLRHAGAQPVTPAAAFERAKLKMHKLDAQFDVEGFV
jgi:hypothetical protein